MKQKFICNLWLCKFPKKGSKAVELLVYSMVAVFSAWISLLNLTTS